jgi:hypothetical protein
MNYLEMLLDIYCSKSAREVRTSVFEYAIALNIQTPGGWSGIKMAGAGRFTKFLTGHKSLSLCRSVVTHAGPASSFNKTNADAFPDNLKEVPHSLQARLGDVWNMKWL